MKRARRRVVHVFGLGLLSIAPAFAQISERDAAMLRELSAANPPGYTLTLSGPLVTADSGPFEVRLQYRQPGPVSTGWTPGADFMLSGFLLRGAVACGIPSLPCPTMETIRDKDKNGAFRREMMNPSDAPLDIRGLLPDLPPGEYVLHALMARIERVEERKPARGNWPGLRVIVRPMQPPSYLISNPYRFRVLAQPD